MSARKSSRHSTPTSERQSQRASTPTRSSSALASAAKAARVSSSTKPLSTATTTATTATPRDVTTSGGMGETASSPLSASAAAALKRRPALPLDCANEIAPKYEGKRHPVKLQTLALDNSGSQVTIARQKCPVPKNTPGHLIKRIDTGGVSASSFFRAAFPTATEAQELAEMDWIARDSGNRYGDTRKAGAEHDETRRLSGTWIEPQYAEMLAREYKIYTWAADLISYTQGSSSGSSLTSTPSSKMNAAKTSISTAAAISGDSDAENSAAGSSPAAAAASLGGSSSSRSAKRARVESPTTTATPGRRSKIKPTTGAKAPLALSKPARAGGKTAPTAEDDDDDDVVLIEKEEINMLGDTAAAPQPSLLPTDEQVEQAVREAKELVATIQQQQEGATGMTASASKRAREDDEGEPEADEEEEEVPVGFFGRMFGRRPTRRSNSSSSSRKRAPITAGREIAPAPTSLVTEEHLDDQGNVVAVERRPVTANRPRRWAAGLGMAVMVGATAAAPYLLG